MDRRLLVGAALLAVAVATWLALRGDAPPRPVVEPSAAATDVGKAIVVGRLVDERGAPLDGLELVIGVIGPARDDTVRRHGPSECMTDESGRFRMALDRPPGDTASAKLEIGRRAPLGRTGWRTVRIALLDLPATLVVGETDVGDVVLRGTGLLVSGVVVDSGGRPLRHVAIRAMKLEFGAYAPITDADATETDAHGRFELRGPAPADRVLVGARFDGFCVPEHAAFAIGATDARIVMTQAGGIAGSVRIPLRRSSFDVDVIVSGPPADNGGADYFRDGLRADVRDDGTFEIRTLRPGVARVRIMLGRSGEYGVLSFDDVRVAAGEVTRDPRMVDVDPLKLSSTLDVRSFDADRTPFRADVDYRRAGTDDWWKRAGGGPVVTIRARSDVIAATGLDVRVSGRGRRSKTIRGVRADTDVVLEKTDAKPANVNLRLAPDSPLPEPPFQLAALLHWIDPDDADDGATTYDPRDARNADARFGKDRLMKFSAVEPGRYRVLFTLLEISMHGSDGGGLGTSPKTVVVTVGGDGAPVEVVVGVDADEFARQTKRSR